MQQQTATNMDISESPRRKDSEHGTQFESSTVLKRRKEITKREVIGCNQTAVNIVIELKIREVKVASTERNQTLLNKKAQEKVQHTAKMQAIKICG